jgi:hypothetical protein
MKEHPAVLHYFYGGTDMYIGEFDGKDEMFCFAIFDGNCKTAEWGYSSLKAIKSIPSMNLDYYWKEQSIEAARYKRYPHYFKKPQSAE